MSCDTNSCRYRVLYEMMCASVVAKRTARASSLHILQGCLSPMQDIDRIFQFLGPLHMSRLNGHTENAHLTCTVIKVSLPDVRHE